MTPDFGKSIVQDWCDRNGWSNPTRQGLTWWAFEGNGVMPKPLPNEAQPINVMPGINHLSVTINSFAQAVGQVARDMAAMPTIPTRSITFSGIADHADPVADIRAAMTRIGSVVTLSPEGRERLRVAIDEWRGQPALALEKSTSLEAAIGRLAPDTPKPIAIARARQFCQAQKCTEAQLIALIDQAQVQMRHGAVCYVKGYRRADWRQTSPASR
jgi:hypothetical protein